MLKARYNQERGHVQHGWLKSAHTFSFAHYYDPAHMHFSHLRVINEDFIAPNSGFDTHPHKDMEILTYVLQGRVAHSDSMGNQTEISAGEFQIMSAGMGMEHSETNPDGKETLHLYQVWILPNEKGITPRYEQRRFPDKQGGTLILSPNGEGASLKVYQNMKLWRFQLIAGSQEMVSIQATRQYWLQVVKGRLKANGMALQISDAVGISQESMLSIEADSDCEFLLFDLV